MNHNLHSDKRDKTGAILESCRPGAFVAQHLQSWPAFSVYQEKFARLLRLPSWSLFDVEGGYVLPYSPDRSCSETRPVKLTINAGNNTSMHIAEGQIRNRHIRLDLGWQQVNNYFYVMNGPAQGLSLAVPAMFSDGSRPRFAPATRLFTRWPSRQGWWLHGSRPQKDILGKFNDGSRPRFAPATRLFTRWSSRQGWWLQGSRPIGETDRLFGRMEPDNTRLQANAEPSRQGLPLGQTFSRVYSHGMGKLLSARQVIYASQAKISSEASPVEKDNAQYVDSEWRDVAPGWLWRSPLMQRHRTIIDSDDTRSAHLKQSVHELLSVINRTETSKAVVSQEQQQSIKKLIHTVSELQQVSKHEVSELRRAVSVLADRFERQTHARTGPGVAPLSFYGRL